MARRSLLHRNTPMPEEALATLTDPGALLLATAVVVAAGFVKGVSGMALPFVLLTGLSLIPPVPVVAAIIAIPALVANVLQARAADGVAALATFREFWLLNTTLFLTTFASTQLLVALEERTLLLTLGTGAFCLAVLQALGPQRELPKRWRKPLEFPCALVGGFFGGLSGLWGTVLVLYIRSPAPRQGDLHPCHRRRPAGRKHPLCCRSSAKRHSEFDDPSAVGRRACARPCWPVGGTQAPQPSEPRHLPADRDRHTACRSTEPDPVRNPGVNCVLFAVGFRAQHRQRQ